MASGVDEFLIITPLEEFVLRPRVGGAVRKTEQLDLARRAARAIRFGLEAGEPQLAFLVQQLLAARLDDSARLQRPQPRDASQQTELFLRLLADRLEQDLLDGRLEVEERKLTPLTDRREPFLPELPPLPPARPAPNTHTFEVRFVDEVGRAISGVEVELKADGPGLRPTNGAGIALVEDVQASSATASIVDAEALANVLDPRWESFRAGAAPKESNTQRVVFRGRPIGPFALKAEVPNTVVIQPPLGSLYAELLDKRGRARHANRTFQIKGPQSFEGTTDAEGRLLIEDVFQGDYQLSLALDFFEGDPDRVIDIVDTPLVVLPAEATQPQVRMLGAVPYSVLARLHMFFNTNKTFLLPTALPAIRKLRRLYIENAPCKLLVVGHADTRGGPAYNDKLSLERAQATIAYLKDDVEGWYKFYSDPDEKKRWGKVEDHLMIISMPDFVSKPKGEDEVRFFQRTRGLKVDGDAGQQTRRALIAEYMSLDGVSLSEFVGEVDAVAHGCGENFPLDDSGEKLDEQPADEKRDPIDRRVELFFFDDEFGISPPPPAANSKPGSTEYPLWRKRVAELVELRAGDLDGPKVTFVEFADAHFRSDSAVVMPEAGQPADPRAAAEPGAIPPPSSAGLIASVLSFNNQTAGLSILVAGHADTTASDAHNDKLSQLRAQLTLALLVGDRATFASIANKHHKVADIKQILAWLARDLADLGFTCAPKKIDETPEKAAVQTFQEEFNASDPALGAPLTPNGQVNEATWGAFFDCFELALARELGEDADGVAALRKKLVFADEERRSLGFGERFPIEELGVDEFRSQTNRRVEILFFQEGETPDLAHAEQDPESSELYLPGFFQRTSLSASALVPAERKLGKLFMELWDASGRTRHAKRPYTIEGPRKLVGTTDDAGRLRHAFVPPGDYTLRLPLKSGEATSVALVLEDADLRPQVRLLGEVKNVAVARLIGLLFDTAKCFILPGAIPAIQRVKQLYDEHPGSKLLVVGHTDTAGSLSSNDVLSLERAEAVLSYLTDKAEDWIIRYDEAQSASKRWGDKEDRDMVSKLPDASSRAASETPMAFFRRTRGLVGSPLRDVRLALIREYMGLDGTSLPKDIDATAHGCGENFPAVATGDGEDLQENRRVELFFFEGAIDPPPPGKNSAPGSKEYPQWSGSVLETLDLRLGGNVAKPIVVQLFVGEEAPDLRGNLIVAGANGKPLRSFPIAELPEGDAGYVFLELLTAGLPDPVSIRRVSEDEDTLLVGPCSLRALNDALDAENFELAGAIGYPKEVST